MRRTMAPLAALALAGGIALSLDGAVFGDAAAQRARESRGPDYVVAHSRWGHGSIAGPVRRGSNGWEVRMPRGTWLECKRSCSETLRLATVDFWETQGRSPPDGGPNYFTLDFWF
ncbi:MAG: hypothetical protein ACK4TL_10015 [Hyphomicrobiaceae bacterium]